MNFKSCDALFALQCKRYKTNICFRYYPEFSRCFGILTFSYFEYKIINQEKQKLLF